MTAIDAIRMSFGDDLAGNAESGAIHARFFVPLAPPRRPLTRPIDRPSSAGSLQRTSIGIRPAPGRGLPESRASEADAGSEGPRASSPVAQLLWSCREELARLKSVVRELRCSAVVRALDGAAIPVSAVDTPVRGGGPADIVSAPLYDAAGGLLAHIELAYAGIERSSLAHNVVRAVVEPVARSMSERWFRICHGRQWIVAAQQVDDPAKCMLLAMNREGEIVGADLGGRQLLKGRGMELEGLSLPTIFRIQTDALSRSRHGEMSFKVRAASDDVSWYLLITAPEPGVGPLGHRALLHSRPRMELVASLAAEDHKVSDGSRLPAYLLRRIEGFVDARLESKIEITELAGSMGYSPSHFFRLFKRSFGITPHMYVMRRRMALAQELITTTRLGLAEIALRAGFSDQSHLSRSFRRFAGLAPRAFRTQHRGMGGGRIT